MIYPKLPDGTIDWCVMCKHEGRAIYDGCFECEYTENSDDSPTKYEPKPMTNGDRIRSMSDEELAEFAAGTGQGCAPGEDFVECCFGHQDGQTEEMCRECWLGWLKQEVKL